MASSCQTRGSIHLAIVAALLFCALALVEFPELLNLRDDTSNDFTLLVSTQNASTAKSAAKPVPTTVAIPVRLTGIQAPISNLLARSFPDTRANSPIDYLHLLCVHRT
jgi:hypothetical protein